MAHPNSNISEKLINNCGNCSIIMNLHLISVPNTAYINYSELSFVLVRIVSHPSFIYVSNSYFIQSVEVKPVHCSQLSIKPYCTYKFNMRKGEFKIVIATSPLRFKDITAERESHVKKQFVLSSPSRTKALNTQIITVPSARKTRVNRKKNVFGSRNAQITTTEK